MDALYVHGLALSKTPEHKNDLLTEMKRFGKVLEGHGALRVGALDDVANGRLMAVSIWGQ